MHRAAPLSAPVRRPRSTSLLQRIGQLFALRRQRDRLRHLPPHILRDIGLTPEQAEREADRPVWDAPRHWRG